MILPFLDFVSFPFADTRLCSRMPFLLILFQSIVGLDLCLRVCELLVEELIPFDCASEEDRPHWLGDYLLLLNGSPE
jgi:hypothetical protein